MNNYEGVFIINIDLTSEATKNLIANLQELVTKNGGRIDNLQEWGKKRLAYPIKKKWDGYYVVMNFQIISTSLKKVEQTVKLNEQIIRYMIINKDEK